MTIFFTADQHYNHQRAIVFRPEYSSIEQMNETLIAKHNERVRPEDTVIMLGDFAFGPESEQMRILERLNGRLMLLRGNHDRTRASCERMGLEVIEVDQRTRSTAFDSLGLGSWDVDLAHYPHWDESLIYDVKFKNKMPLSTGRWLLHGHTHNFMPTVVDYAGLQINVGVDHWNDYPVSKADLAITMWDAVHTLDGVIDFRKETRI